MALTYAYLNNRFGGEPALLSISDGVAFTYPIEDAPKLAAEYRDIARDFQAKGYSTASSYTGWADQIDAALAAHTALNNAEAKAISASVGKLEAAA